MEVAPGERVIVELQGLFNHRAVGLSAAAATVTQIATFGILERVPMHPKLKFVWMCLPVVLLSVASPKSCSAEAAQNDDPAVRLGASSMEVLTYEVVSTIEYRGTGHFAACSAGVLLQGRTPPAEGTATYHLAADMAVVADDDDAVAEIFTPVTSLRRDPKTHCIVGGKSEMRNVGAVINTALAQIDSPLACDDSVQKRKFRFNVPTKFPAELEFSLRARRHKLPTVGEVVVALAEAPVRYEALESHRTIEAQHRVLAVMDSEMQELLLYLSVFTATGPGDEEPGHMRIEKFVVQLREDQPVPLTDLEDAFPEYFDALELADDELSPKSNIIPPRWVWHSLAAHDVAEATAAVAIEGNSNPLPIVAAVAAIKTADSVLSTSTFVLHQAGVIDQEWKGLTTYAGEAVGLVGAACYEEATGREADRQFWKDTGGTLASVADLVKPQRLLKAGRSGVRGMKMLRNVGRRKEVLQRLAGQVGTLRVAMRKTATLKNLTTALKSPDILTRSADLIGGVSTATGTWDYVSKYGFKRPQPKVVDPPTPLAGEERSFGPYTSAHRKTTETLELPDDFARVLVSVDGNRYGNALRYLGINRQTVWSYRETDKERGPIYQNAIYGQDETIDSGQGKCVDVSSLCRPGENKLEIHTRGETTGRVQVRIDRGGWHPGWPFDAATAAGRQLAVAQRYGVPVRKQIELATGIAMKMVLVPPGQFVMGSSEKQDQRPAHPVRITRPFYLGTTELTQQQYLQLAGEENPSRFSEQGDGKKLVEHLDTRRLPVEGLSFADALAVMNRLSERKGLAPYYRLSAKYSEYSGCRQVIEVLGGDGFRLPTEAEWDYACRAGSDAEYFFGDDPALLDQYAWHQGNSGRHTHVVATKRPNAFGLYDMIGNVAELCFDRYSARGYRSDELQVNPVGSRSGGASLYNWNEGRSYTVPARVARGGRYNNKAEDFQSASRSYALLDRKSFGLRIAQDLPSE